ncbi:hypothetical protein [Jatrophihabitans sp.]
MTAALVIGGSSEIGAAIGRVLAELSWLGISDNTPVLLGRR